MFDLESTILPAVPVLELIFRGTVTFLVLHALLRIVGQREAGGLGMTDLLVVVLVADAASTGMAGGAETLGDGFILVATILLWSVVLDALAYRFPIVARIVKSRPRTLVRDGDLNRRAMLRELMTREELLSQLRLHGIDDPTGVHRAYLEPGGMVSVIPEPEQETVDDGPSRPPLE